jgi:hypothetical protein
VVKIAVVVTNAGEAWAAGRLAGTIATDAHFVAWGTGAGTAAKADTTLSTEASESRVNGTVTVEGTGASAVYQVVGTLTANATKTITNAGNLTASTSGTLVVHGDHTGVPLDLGESITYTIAVNPA